MSELVIPYGGRDLDCLLVLHGCGIPDGEPWHVWEMLWPDVPQGDDTANGGEQQQLLVRYRLLSLLFRFRLAPEPSLN